MYKLESFVEVEDLAKLETRMMKERAQGRVMFLGPSAIRRGAATLPPARRRAQHQHRAITVLYVEEVVQEVLPPVNKISSPKNEDRR